jgi:hypothetical protein
MDMKADSVGTRFSRLDVAAVAGKVGKVYGPTGNSQLIGQALILKALRPNGHNAGFMATFQTATMDLTISVASTWGFAYFTDQDAARAAFAA